MALFGKIAGPLRVETPFGPGAVVADSLAGEEGLSRLFRFELGLLAEQPIPFEKLLGNALAVELAVPGCPPRWLHGLVCRLVEHGEVVVAGTTVIRYRATLVPRCWLWTQRTHARIFQDLSVPDVLRQVFDGLEVAWHLGADYPRRNHITQFDESDFDFACRLMEDEGIRYYFDHEEKVDRLVLHDGVAAAPEFAAAVAFRRVLEGAHAGIFAWHKSQSIRPARHVVADHNFAFPRNRLEANHHFAERAKVGQRQQTLTLPVHQHLEVFDYPAGYAWRFDGIDKSGSAQAASLQQLFEANAHVARLRNEAEAARALTIEGKSTCSHFLPGHRFALERHGQADGKYLLESVAHEVSLQGELGEAEPPRVVYENRFRCLPESIVYRPPRATARPRIVGPQTATVVGAASADVKKEAIHCDPYGRVKVQFHWDQNGKYDLNSSCWVRVSQAWAGKGFGAVHVPRTGDEVIVVFEDGDPDRPLIVGTVYNSEKVAGPTLPDQATWSGIRSRSVEKGSSNCHEIRFDDTVGQEELTLHAEQHLHQEAESSMTHFVGWGAGGSGTGSGDDDDTGNGGEGGNGGEADKDKNGSKAPFAWFQAIKGQNFESFWGLDGDLVLGPYFETVFGSSVDLAAPLRADVTLGVDGELVVGTLIESVIGPSFEFQRGPSIKIQNGNAYDFTKGNVLRKTEGSVFEIVNDGDLTFAVNGWVVSTFSKDELTPADTQAMKHAAGQVKLATGPLLGMTTNQLVLDTLSADQLERDFAKDIIASINAFTSTNPILMIEAFKEYFVLLYDDASIVTKGGDIHLTALGAGKKIVIQADTIELRGNTVTRYSTGNSGYQVNLAQPAVFTDELPMQEACVGLEAKLIEEAMHIMELDTENALEYTLESTTWVILLTVLVSLMLITVGIGLATAVSARPK